MADELNRSEYLAVLCHRRNGWLVDFASTRFFASNEAEAKQNATRWADSVAAPLVGSRKRPGFKCSWMAKPFIRRCIRSPNYPHRDFRVTSISPPISHMVLAAKQTSKGRGPTIGIAGI